MIKNDSITLNDVNKKKEIECNNKNKQQQQQQQEQQKEQYQYLTIYDEVELYEFTEAEWKNPLCQEGYIERSFIQEEMYLDLLNTSSSSLSSFSSSISSSLSMATSSSSFSSNNNFSYSSSGY